MFRYISQGNPYGLGAVLGVCFPFFYFARLYWPVPPMINIVLWVTVVLVSNDRWIRSVRWSWLTTRWKVVGYSYLDLHIIVPGNPGSGFSVAWRRFLLVTCGVVAALWVTFGLVYFVWLTNWNMIVSYRFYRLQRPSDDTKDVCFPQRAVNLAQSIVQLFHMLTLIGSRRYKKLLRAWSRFEASWKDRWCCVQMWFMRYAFTSLMFIHLDVSTIYPSSRFEDAGLLSDTTKSWIFSCMSSFHYLMCQNWEDKIRQITSSLAYLMSIIEHMEPAWSRALLKRTRFTDPDFQGDILAVISQTFSVLASRFFVCTHTYSGMVSSSLRTGNPLPQITPTPLLDRFMLKYHGLDIIHKESEEDYGLPRALTLDTLQDEQYL